MPKKTPRRIAIVGDIAIVRLTRGYISIIDAEDAALISGMCFQAQPHGNTIYAKSGDASLHSIINKTPSGMVTDHINGNGLDNRKINLRSVTNAENQWKSKTGKNSKSGLKGVSWRSREKKWRAEITRHGKRYDLGLFDCKKMASIAYGVKAFELEREAKK